MHERTITVDRLENVIDVFGSFDENIKLLEQAYGVRIVNRETELRIAGEDAEAVFKAEKVLNGLFTLSSRGEPISTQNVRYCISLVDEGSEEKISELASDVICVTAKGRPVKGKTIGQRRYIEAILKNTITVGIGPAGTGKTYLAVACAVAAFRESA